MKKRIYLAVALLLSLMSFLFLPAAKTAKAVDPPAGFMYYSEHFNAAPLTFEAWIRLPEDLPDGAYGGTILGNYNSILNHLGIFNFEIHTGGNFRVYWETMAFTHVFTAVDFRTGDWEHVALVREPGKFVLYHNGEIVGQAASDAPLRPDCTAYVAIGNDYRYSPKQPFLGDIRQITVYSEPVTQSRVRADMANGNITDGGGFNLLASWYWGDDWGEERAFADLSGNGKDALFGHYDTFYSLTPEEDYDYTIVFMPDPQIMTNYDPARFVYMNTWIKNNADRLNIKFVMNLGDIIDGGSASSRQRQWASAVDAMNVLYGTVPHSFIPGNHDYDELYDSRSLEEYNTYFPYDKYSVLPTFGGAFKAGEMENTYHLFEAGEVKYIVLALEYAPRLAVLEWANRLIAAHPTHRAIVTTHAYMGYSGRPMQPENGTIFNFIGFDTKSGVEANDGIDLWNKSFRHHDNLFIVANGHVDHDNVMYYEDKGLKGNRVHQFLIDGQCILRQPEDLLFIMRVNERTQTVHANYYSPYRDKYFNVQNQIAFSFADENNPAINVAQGGGNEGGDGGAACPGDCSPCGCACPGCCGASCDCASVPGGASVPNGGNGCSGSADAAFALTGLLAAAVLFFKRPL
ncbi:MAG: metallophosphoesterase [Clostridiales bacterium]|nr:metallophosphoesterase [Clostridiales bacterium]